MLKEQSGTWNTLTSTTYVSGDYTGEAIGRFEYNLTSWNLWQFSFSQDGYTENWWSPWPAKAEARFTANNFGIRLSLQYLPRQVFGLLPPVKTMLLYWINNGTDELVLTDTRWEQVLKIALWRYNATRLKVGVVRGSSSWERTFNVPSSFWSSVSLSWKVRKIDDNWVKGYRYGEFVTTGGDVEPTNQERARSLWDTIIGALGFLKDLFVMLWNLGSQMMTYGLVLYAMYLLVLVVRCVNEGSPEPLMNHIMFVYQVITQIINAIATVIEAVWPF